MAMLILIFGLTSVHTLDSCNTNSSYCLNGAQCGINGNCVCTINYEGDRCDIQILKSAQVKFSQEHFSSGLLALIVTGVMIGLPITLYILIIVLSSILSGEYSLKLICQNLRQAFCIPKSTIKANAKVHNVDLIDGEKSVETKRNVQIIVEEEQDDKNNESKRSFNATNAQLVQKPIEKSQDKIKTLFKKDRIETVEELIVKQIDDKLIPEQQSLNMMSQIKQLPKILETRGQLNIQQLSPQTSKQPPNSATALKQKLSVNDMPSFDQRQLNNSRRSQGILEIKKNIDKEWDDISNGSKKPSLWSNSEHEQ